MRLAFIGPQRSGKTTTAEFVARMTEDEAVVMPFSAGVLNEVFRGVISANGRRPDAMALEDMYEQYREDKDHWRPLMVAWGMWRRSSNEDYWLDRWVRAATEARDYWGEDVHLLSDDCRFPNEYAMLKDEGFQFIRLAPNPADDGRGAQEAPEAHFAGFKWDHYLPWMPVTERYKNLKEVNLV